MRLRTVLLTIPVLALLTQPLWAPQWGAGMLGEIAALGPWGSIAAIAGFFGLVALYVRTLAQLLVPVPPAARARSPRSLWLMFAIPLNFVEDIEIVRDIATSLRAERRLAPRAIGWWQAMGLGWCALQIISLAPTEVGVAGGGLGLALWAAHWVFTGVLIRRRRAAH